MDLQQVAWSYRIDNPFDDNPLVNRRNDETFPDAVHRSSRQPLHQQNYKNRTRKCETREGIARADEGIQGFAMCCQD